MLSRSGYGSKMGQEKSKRQSGFAGTLKNLQLIDIMQLCCLSVSTMGIKVTRNEAEGIIYIQEGKVVHAQQGDTVGVDAFYVIMCWASGVFETFDVDDVQERSINENCQFLLIEATRRMDETSQKPEKEITAETEKKLRVLIVDDSPIMTKILTSVYTAQGGVEIAGTARNGEQAIEMIDKTKPDLITLDVNMPVMDGSTALKHIMIKKPCPVIVMSNLGEASQGKVLQFLDLGAVDFMSKPVRHKNILLQQDKMIQRLRRCAESNINAFRRTPLPKPVVDAQKKAHDLSECKELIVINSGASPPAAMLQLIANISKVKDCSIVLLQSLPPDLIPLLAEFMDQRSMQHIVPVMDRMKLENSKVYVSTTGTGLELVPVSSGYSLCLDEDSDSDAQLTSEFDRFLISVARTFKGRVTVVLLSGADIDRLEGLEQIAASKGSIIIQDRKTCIMKGSLDFVKESDLQIAEIQMTDIGDCLLKN